MDFTENDAKMSKKRQGKKGIDDLSAFEKDAVHRLQKGEGLGGVDGILAPMIKRILEASLDVELEAHLQQDKAAGLKNRRNGQQQKQLRTQYGSIELETSRDRDGSFEPQLVKKRQVTLGEGLDNKIISMYSKGMSYSDISTHLEELYGIEMSKSKLSQITDKVLPLLESWQTRELSEVYAIVWMDALVFKIRRNGRIEKHAVFVVLGIDEEGQKDVLGLYHADNEGAKFWLSILTDLQNRGLKDILIACTDNLKGFTEAINSIYPETEVQLCIVHQIRNSLKYVTSEDEKPFIKDLKLVYKAISKESAEHHLSELDKKWGKKYPIVLRSWRSNWNELSTYFKFGKEIRRIIYTTNTVEGFNRQLRKVTKSKSVFPNEKALMKMVFLATADILKKWTSPVPKWALVVQQLAIHFEGRLNLKLKLGDEKETE